MNLIQREGYKILDVRSARDYDEKHITKPARSSLNAPVVMNDNSTPNPRFLEEVCTGWRYHFQVSASIAA
jgi:rhodanese-related sulfurtransferase